MSGKLTALLSAILMFPVWGIAQQLPLFSQYREHATVINPAAVASNYLLYNQTGAVSLSVRNQWVSKEGAPTTQVLQGYTMLTDYATSPIIGGYLINDQVGRVGTTGLYGRFGAVLSEDPSTNGIAAGITLGMVQYRVDLDGIIARDLDDELIENQDLQRKIYPDAGLGIYAWQSINDNDYITGGISVPQVLSLDVTFRNPSDKKFSLDRVRHYYAMAGWIHDLPRDGSKLELNSWLKYVPHAPFHFDANIRYQIGQDMWDFWIGAGYGTSQAIHLETGFILGEDRPIKIGYGLDFNTSNKILSFGQSHEINLSYGFGSSDAWRR
jgi:type IX secretion system PorP/SprF family membrane protein